MALSLKPNVKKDKCGKLEGKRRPDLFFASNRLSLFKGFVRPSCGHKMNTFLELACFYQKHIKD